MLIAPYLPEERTTEVGSLLIVDDASTVCALLRRLFQNDHTVICAENGTEALVWLEKQAFDLVLLDVNLPGVSGFDVLRTLRDNPATADLPVILMSALHDNSSVVQGLQLGANDYITKPLDGEVVKARVNTQLALKRAADERKQTIAQLKFTQEMQENFTRIVSHDLKGPLTNIRMAQFMLRDIMRENDQARSILDNMDATLNGMLDMIRMFLDAMDSQQLEPEIDALNLNEAILFAVEQYQLAAERKNITLTVGDCDHKVLADRRLLRQVLSNLISNAIKFSPQGTQTQIWAEPCADMIRISVADEGPGIPEDEQSQLFSMFSKISVRPTGGESSTGLGLWIVKELTAIQGGRVGVDARVGGGSVFWIEVPAA